MPGLKSAESPATKIEERLEAIRKSGLPTTPQELNEWYASVPVTDNAAAKFAVAFRKIVRPAAGEKLPGTVSWPDPTKPMPGQVKGALNAYLARNKSALELLLQAACAELEGSRYPVNLEVGITTQLPHLSDAKAASQLLAWSIAMDAENGDIDSAVKSLQAILKLARTLDGEPIHFSQLVRMAIDASGSLSLERLLNRRTLTDAQLTSLEAELRKAGESGGLARSFVGERCMIFGLLDLKPDALAKLLSGVASGEMPKEIPQDKIAEFERQFARTQNAEKKLLLDYFDACVGACSNSWPKRLDVATELDRLIDDAKQSNLLISSTLLPALGMQSIVKDAEITARMRLGQLAIAMERFRAANGSKLPQTLSELSPAFLNSIPPDPFDGQPLRFNRLTKGYTLYSVGSDRKDDGGLVISVDAPPADGKRPKAADLVFSVLR